MEYAILATLWNGPASTPELLAALPERLGRPVSPRLVESYLWMLQRFGFVESDEASSPYRITDRGSLYLSNTALA